MDPCVQSRRAALIARFGHSREGSPGMICFVDELILRTVVIQFDGRVVEVFGGRTGEVARQHVALMPAPEIRAPNRQGRTQIHLAGTVIAVDADELERLNPYLAKITEAIRAARR
jgi:hypothetical protein